MNQNTFGVPGSSTNNQQPSASSTAFTASMRDKQARGRDPYEQDDECPAGRDGDGDVDMDDDGSDAEDARLRAEGRKLRLGAAP